MNYLNLEELTRLCQGIDESTMSSIMKDGSERYGVKLGVDS
jgi:hypothetical protein